MKRTLILINLALSACAPASAPTHTQRDTVANCHPCANEHCHSHQLTHGNPYGHTNPTAHQHTHADGNSHACSHLHPLRRGLL